MGQRFSVGRALLLAVWLVWASILSLGDFSLVVEVILRLLAVAEKIDLRCHLVGVLLGPDKLM